jgi:hypothetical protein
MSAGLVYTHAVTENSIVTAKFVPTFTVTVEVISEDGGTFEYSTDDGETWHPMTETSSGIYTVPVDLFEGTDLRIRAVPDIDGQNVIWNHGSPLMSAGLVYTHAVTDNAIVTAKFVPTFTVTVEVISEDGGTFEYSTDQGGTWDPMTETSPGRHTVLADIFHGTILWIRAVPDTDGHNVIWNHGSPLRSTDLVYTHTVTDHTIVTATFEPGDERFVLPDEIKKILWPWALILLTGVFVLLLFVMMGPGNIITGTVTYRGEPLAGAKIEYTVKGDPEFSVTDQNGIYEITAFGRSGIIITAVRFDGEPLYEMKKDDELISGSLPLEMEIKARRTEVNFRDA